MRPPRIILLFDRIEPAMLQPGPLHSPGCTDLPPGARAYGIGRSPGSRARIYRARTVKHGLMWKASGSYDGRYMPGSRGGAMMQSGKKEEKSSRRLSRDNTKGGGHQRKKSMPKLGDNPALLKMLSDPNNLYRGMRQDGNAPRIGRSARDLGVRIPQDVQPDENGMVEDPKKGLSTAKGHPKNLPAHRKPPEFGGTGKDPVWAIDESKVNNEDLMTTNDHGNHVVVGPKRRMKLEQYEKALERTRPHWKKVPTN